MDNTILIAGAAFIALIAFFLRRRHVIASRVLWARQEEDHRIQQGVLNEMDKLGKFLEDTALDPSELGAQAEAVFARIRSVRGDDTLEPLITDSRNFVHEECARRGGA